MLPSRIFLDDLFNDVEHPIKHDKVMKCDVYQKNNNYIIEMDMPGCKKEDLTIDLEKGYLTINYSKEEKELNEDKKYIHRERHSITNCSRQFYVGDVEEANINASFKDGILTITVPLKEEKETKKIISID